MTADPKSVGRIDPGQIKTFEPEPGRIITVIDGAVWITQNDERDIILEAGDSIVLDGRGQAVLSALAGPATFRSDWREIERLAA